MLRAVPKLKPRTSQCPELTLGCFDPPGCLGPKRVSNLFENVADIASTVARIHAQTSARNGDRICPKLWPTSYLQARKPSTAINSCLAVLLMQLSCLLRSRKAGRRRLETTRPPAKDHPDNLALLFFTHDCNFPQILLRRHVYIPPAWTCLSSMMVSPKSHGARAYKFHT